MRGYVDLSFLGHLLLQSRRTAEANALLRRVELPLALNDLHELQVENLFQHLALSGERGAAAVLRARRSWQSWLAEMVFLHRDAGWSGNFAAAHRLCRIHTSPDLTPVGFLHVAAAVSSRADALLSYDAPVRVLAKSQGLAVLPQRL